MFIVLLAALLAAAAEETQPPAPPVLAPAPPVRRTVADPEAEATRLAGLLPIARHALRESFKAAAAIEDPPLRAAVEVQLKAPWLPPEAFAYQHPKEATEKLHALGLLGEGVALQLPPSGKGTFASAPGGPCPHGHHSYPGGLSVHSFANLMHARGLATAYAEAYGVKLDDGWLVAAALWHDTLKAATLPWDAEGNCPSTEPLLAGTALHHPLGLAAAILRRLPTRLIWVIAASHAPPSPERIGEVCSWIRAAGVIARGDERAVPCPQLAPGAPPPPAEAFVNHFADADFFFTIPVADWYAAHTPSGWARYEALLQDQSDVAAWFRAQQR